MLHVLITCYLATTVILSGKRNKHGNELIAEPVVLTGVAKLNNALETMKTQQAEDTKKKQQLEKLCKNEGAIQSEKQRVLSQHIQDNMKNVSILERNLKTYKSQIYNWTSDLTAQETKGKTWTYINDRTAEMKALSIQQRESFHTELQSTSDIVGNFLDKVKEMQAQKEANKKGGKTVSNTKLQSPLNSILNKISKAKAMSVAHRQQASQRSEKFHAMIRLKVDKQSEAMKTIKAHISDVQNAANTAEDQVAALRTAVETADKSLRLSRNISNYYDNVCQDYLSGFVGRMTHRENVQKETQVAIAWYQNQLQEVERVMEKLNVPETTAPPTPPPAAPCAQSPCQRAAPDPPNPPPASPCAGSPCQPSLRGRKPVNQQLLIVSSALPNQETDEEADGETNQQLRFQNQKTLQNQKTRLQKIFSYVPAYKHQQIIETSDDTHPRKNQERFAQQLSDEFNSKLESEKTRLINIKEKPAKVVRVGFKTQA